MYTITLWKLNSDQLVEQTVECTCETNWSAIEVFDCITRGVRGYYKAWIVDTTTDICIRESSLTKE